MELKAKRKKELESRKKAVVEAAIAVFKEKGIAASRLSDVADKAAVGVASVYRYFKTKKDLAAACAAEIWETQFIPLTGLFSSFEYQNLSGFEEMKLILNQFMAVYKTYPDSLRFIEEFDNYLVKESLAGDTIEAYEQTVIGLRQIVFSALEKGKQDQTIRRGIQNNDFYMAVTHALTSLSQKLVTRGALFKSDREVTGEKQLSVMIEMALCYLKYTEDEYES